MSSIFSWAVKNPVKTATLFGAAAGGAEGREFVAPLRSVIESHPAFGKVPDYQNILVTSVGLSAAIGSFAGCVAFSALRAAYRHPIVTAAAGFGAYKAYENKEDVEKVAKIAEKHARALYKEISR